jgi:hypothetical protein
MESYSSSSWSAAVVSLESEREVVDDGGGFFNIDDTNSGLFEISRFRFFFFCERNGILILVDPLMIALDLPGADVDMMVLMVNIF